VVVFTQCGLQKTTAMIEKGMLRLVALKAVAPKAVATAAAKAA
jgi:hypothetical protein